MERRLFGRTGLMVSALGYGTAPTAYLNTEQQQAVDLLNRMLDSGMNVIDTAASYPGSEQFIGDFFSARRSDYVLISKCGTRISGFDAAPFSYELVKHSIDRSLKLLKTDVIDVMLLHSCDLETLKEGDAVRALLEARGAGKIRFAGYSGDNDAVAYAAAMPDLAVVEMSLSIADQRNIDLGLAVAQQHNTGVIAKRPLANAAWKNISDQPGFYSSYAKSYTERLAQMKLTPGDLGFDGPPERAWPQIALRFTLSLPGVGTAIAGTTNPSNAQANLAAVNDGPLPAPVVEQIRKAFREADPQGAWAGLQ